MRICKNCSERNPDRAQFCMMCAAPLGGPELLSESRRVVTVLFADLKGSTSIGERLDPEAVRRVLTRFYEAARDVIEEHGGTVEKFIGDAVMAVFGVPRVHEDDALRGVRAAAKLQEVFVAMNDELLRTKYGVGLELRIGVNTGEVVAGDPRTGSSFVAGDTVNVGARLEQAAPPGEVLIGEETWRSVRDAVDVEPTEPLALKGKSNSIVAYRLVALSTAPSHAGRSMIGRDREAERLDAAFRTAISERRAVSLQLTGPAGIGKTHLAENALVRWHDDANARPIIVRCSPPGEGDPLGPVIGLLAGLAELPDGAATRRVEDAVLVRMSGRERGAVVAATLAQLASGGDGRPVQDVAFAIRELASAVFERDERPLAILIDEAHWADPDVRHVIRELEAGARWPLVVLETVLPEFASHEDWTITVPPLSVEHARSLLRSIVGEVPDEERLLEHAEGNPLFLIESARMLRDQDTSAASRDGTSDVPTTIRGLIAARLGHLPAIEVRVLEAAAVIGRVFPHQAVTAIGHLEAEDVRHAVRQLELRDLLAPIDVPHGPNVAFSHALVRDVAYASLVKEDRAALHERYAAWAEARGRSVASVVGYHLERAFRLRCELGVPGPAEGLLAAKAAIAFAEAGLALADADNRRGALDALARTAELAAESEAAFGQIVDHVEAARRATGELAYRVGEWPVAIEALEPFADGEDGEAIYRLGVALVQANRGSAGPAMERGRALLARIQPQQPTVDIQATLAGSWKGIDDARALELYREALEIDPGDPYALGNALELEAAAAGSLPPLGELASSLDAAAQRCRDRVASGDDLPWSCFDLAKFSLLGGRGDEAFDAACLAVSRSTAPFMIRTSLVSMERFDALAHEPIAGLDQIEWLYRLGLAIRFDDADASDTLGPLGSADGGHLEPPLVILAGGSSAEAAADVARRGAIVVEAMRGMRGTLVSGATTTGVSAIAGDVAADNAGFRAVGYVPASVPDGVELDSDLTRYSDIRRTRGSGFGVEEPLGYWADIVASGIPASQVSLIAIGGGRISAAEYRMALAFGARVGVLGGSGGSASELLRDASWATSLRLVELPNEVERIRAFLVEAEGTPLASSTPSSL